VSRSYINLKMASAQISLMMPPHIDSLNIPVAFGTRLIPKLDEELHSDVLTIRQKALSVLADRIHNPEHAYTAIKLGSVLTLCRLLGDDDKYVRYKSACIFVTIASHAVGRSEMIKRKVVTTLSKLFYDEEDAVRFAAVQAVSMLCETFYGAKSVVEEKLVGMLIKKISDDRTEIRELILNTLHLCFRIDPEEALDCDIFSYLKKLLKTNEQSRTCKQAADLLADVCTCPRGKRLAVDDGEIVPRLVELIQACNGEVVASVANAMCMIAITTEGKYAFIKHDAIPALIPATESRFADVKLYATKCLTLLAEAPEGRCLMKRDGFAAKWEKQARPEVLCLDNLLNKRAKHICSKVVYRRV